MITKKEGRYFLTDHIRAVVDFSRTAQSLGVPPPPAVKSAERSTPRTALPDPASVEQVKRVDLYALIRDRRSVRQYRPAPLRLDELSFLLWATQGIEDRGPTRTLRTVPSAGGRHAFETYIVVNRVDSLAPAIYRYLPLEQSLAHHGDKTAWDSRLDDRQGFFLQPFVRDSAVVFIWSVLPCRMEWRYAEAAYKVLAIDAGHVGQNLYLAAEALGCGVCAIGAYNQTAVDQVLGFDGDEEFTIYIASLGRKQR